MATSALPRLALDGDLSSCFRHEDTVRVRELPDMCPRCFRQRRRAGTVLGLSVMMERPCKTGKGLHGDQRLLILVHRDVTVRADLDREAPTRRASGRPCAAPL